LRTFTSTLAALFLFTSTGAVCAQGSDQKAAAEVLFNEGRKLMDAGNFAEGCSRLEQSQQIDPAVGTLGWLAQCYEKSGKTASAWATYRQAASFAEQRGQAERQRMALEQAATLEPWLSRLTIDAGAVSAVEGVEIFRNGKPVVRALWGTPIPVDPGEQRLEVRAPGYQSAALSVSVASSRGKAVLRLPELIRVADPAPDAAATPKDPSERAAAATFAASASAPVAATQDVPPARHRGGVPAQALAGYFVGGLGVVGLGAGLAFYFQKNSKLSARDAACPAVEAGGDCPTSGKREEYGDRQDEADTASTVSLVSTLAGAALTTTGVVLLVTAPSRQAEAARRMKIAPVALRGGAGLWMETTW
jgi:hypothetical protein